MFYLFIDASQHNEQEHQQDQPIAQYARKELYTIGIEGRIDHTMRATIEEMPSTQLRL